MQKKPLQKAVFLDRDGTLIHDRPGHYLSEPAKLRLYRNTPAALKMLADKGFRLFVVSNQSGVGRGYYTLATANAINDHLEKLLSRHGVKIAEISICPHAPSTPCECRKPAPAMGLRLMAKHGIDPSRSYMVGDKLSDMEFGRNIGVRTVFVKTGHGRSQSEKHGEKLAPSIKANDILRAAQRICDEIQD